MTSRKTVSMFNTSWILMPYGVLTLGRTERMFIIQMKVAHTFCIMQSYKLK